MKHTRQGQAFTEIVLEVFKLSGLLVTEGDKLTAEFGLTSARWKILGALIRSNNPITVSQIARLMGQTRQAVQRLTDDMQKEDLLAFIDNPNHKRAKLVSLTKKGEEIYYQLEQKQIPWANQCSADITATDLETTLTALRHISNLFKIK
ncbi:MarR family winged helix-turn-helix transcriptional regulator [Spartinivicinus ruber]|uniref:MarR family winged helix-turn-helix transcriptional regulator n=1 Tax=Spartinivicinus ruber TaxID=2683272 RepID=UPI0013D8DD6D|nr:MarR family transcriptional regulator [Spartinivicinus ruber]